MTPDPCCFLCKHPSGVCLTRLTCEHHQLADARQRAADSRRITSYPDPTGEAAVRNADRDRKKNR